MTKVLYLIITILLATGCDKYNKAFDYRDGMARVMKYAHGGKTIYGYIDETGELMVEVKYRVAEDFNNGIAIVADNEYRHGVIDKSGKEIIPCRYHSDLKIRGDYVITSEDGPRCSIFDLKGNCMISGKYDRIIDICEGYASFKLDDSYGVVNCENGEERIFEETVAHIDTFVNGFAVVYAAKYYGGLKGMINCRGEYIIPPIYFNVNQFSNGLARVEFCESYIQTVVKSREVGGTEYISNMDNESLDPLFGFYNESGKLVIPLKYCCAHDFSDNLAYVQETNDPYREQRLYPTYKPDEKPIVVANMILNTWKSFKMHQIDYSKDKKYFIDKTGKKVLTVNYDAVYDFIHGVAVVYKKGKGYGCIDKTGKETVSCIYKTKEEAQNAI
jgi:hypothetical protein